MLPDLGFEMCERLSRHRNRCQSLFYDGFVEKIATAGISPRHRYTDERNTLPGIGAHPDYSGNSETGVEISPQPKDKPVEGSTSSIFGNLKQAMALDVNALVSQQTAALPTNLQNGAPTPPQMGLPPQPGTPTQLPNASPPGQLKQSGLFNYNPVRGLMGSGAGALLGGLAGHYGGQALGSSPDTQAALTKILVGGGLAGGALAGLQNPTEQQLQLALVEKQLKEQQKQDYTHAMDEYKARLSAAEN